MALVKRSATFIRRSLVLAMLAMIAVPAGVDADVLVNAIEPPTVACGKTVMPGIWYQSFSGGPRWAHMTIKKSHGAVAWRKNGDGHVELALLALPRDLWSQLRPDLRDGRRNRKVPVSREDVSVSSRPAPRANRNSRAVSLRTRSWRDGTSGHPLAPAARGGRAPESVGGSWKWSSADTWRNALSLKTRARRAACRIERMHRKRRHAARGSSRVLIQLPELPVTSIGSPNGRQLCRTPMPIGASEPSAVATTALPRMSP